ncbi:MAG: M28 family peptidase [Vicinamibacterales bacterium]
MRTSPYEGGSDHTSFLRAGVPALLNWHFTDRYYHTNLDTIDKVSAAEMGHVAAIVHDRGAPGDGAEEADVEPVRALLRQGPAPRRCDSTPSGATPRPVRCSRRGRPGHADVRESAGRLGVVRGQRPLTSRMPHDPAEQPAHLRVALGRVWIASVISAGTAGAGLGLVVWATGGVRSSMAWAGVRDPVPDALRPSVIARCWPAARLAPAGEWRAAGGVG